MDYKEYARRENSFFSTGVNTRINSKFRVSSIYRRYANSNFESWGWETFLWKNERIEKEFPTLDSAEEVVDLHANILSEFN